MRGPAEVLPRSTLQPERSLGSVQSRKMASSSAAGGSAEGLLESVFLVLVYGFVMFRGSKLVNEGRQALVEIFTPGITSAMLLTFIPSLPTAIVILSK